MNNITLPVLYILMRNDIASMNPGKLAAQASHASNAFVARFHEHSDSQAMNSVTDEFVTLNNAFFQWQSSTKQSFGTVLVLEGSMKDISESVDYAKKFNYLADVIHDPTYPIVDGSIVHHIPLDTCGYVFVPNKFDPSCTVTNHLSTYDLYK